MTIYSGFNDLPSENMSKWWFSIVMLIYQRVSITIHLGKLLSGWWCNKHLEKWWSSSMGRMTSHIWNGTYRIHVWSYYCDYIIYIYISLVGIIPYIEKKCLKPPNIEKEVEKPQNGKNHPIYEMESHEIPWFQTTKHRKIGGKATDFSPLRISGPPFMVGFSWIFHIEAVGKFSQVLGTELLGIAKVL